MVTTLRRVQYALGYVALGMLNEASDELEAIDFDDRFKPEVMQARISLHVAADQWDIVGNYARKLLQIDNDDVNGWIPLGCAVRRTDGIAAARDLLLEIEPKLGTEHAVIHYNLVCYHFLLGEMEAAKARLVTACRMDAAFRTAALDDPHLKAMWDDIAAMK